jgi:two-component system chemotaxis response regulator CheB
LEEILPNLPENFPCPVLVAQHMGRTFTKVLAERFNGCCALSVQEVEGAVPLLPGHILVARGDADLILTKRAGHIVAINVPPDDRYIWHPSVDRLMFSVMEHVPAEIVIGVELTGMGNDGAAAMTELHQRGGKTVAESEETAVVYGMPKSLVDMAGADMTLPSYKIADQVIHWAERLAKKAAR